jgi:hypothetical protein
VEREVRGEEQRQPHAAPDEPEKPEDEEASPGHLPEIEATPPYMRAHEAFIRLTGPETPARDRVREYPGFRTLGREPQASSRDRGFFLRENTLLRGDPEALRGDPEAPSWSRGAQLLPSRPEAESPLSHDVPRSSPQLSLIDAIAEYAAEYLGDPIGVQLGRSERPGIAPVLSGSGGTGKTRLARERAFQSLAEDEAQHEAERETPVQMDDDYYDEVGKAVGRGTTSVLLGTSTRSLKRSLSKLRDGRRDQEGQ